MTVVNRYATKGFEFETLMGYPDTAVDTAEQLGAKHIAHYVPFGHEWLPYMSRRTEYFKKLRRHVDAMIRYVTLMMMFALDT